MPRHAEGDRIVLSLELRPESSSGRRRSMIGIPDFFASGASSLPISPDEIQLVSLIGFILVSLVYSCGSLQTKPEKILDVMLKSGRGDPQLRKAVAFVRDALRKHPSI